MGGKFGRRANSERGVRSHRASSLNLVLDAWEHAFYLQYQNRKVEFFDAVWNLWNWDDVTVRFNRGRGRGAEHEVPVGRGN
jgi:superoxide dismutase